MNTTANETKMTLKDAFINEVGNLNGMAVPKKTFIARIAVKYPQFTTGYISAFLNKCIVNNPNREKWGQAIDLFAVNGNGYLISSEKYRSDFPIVTENKEHRASKIIAARQVKQTDMSSILNAYMDGATFQM